MMTTDLDFIMHDVEQALIQTRTRIHSFSADSVVLQASIGITKADTVRVGSESLMDKYRFRQTGLAIATFIITLLAIALYFKIRQVEGR